MKNRNEIVPYLIRFMLGDYVSSQVSAQVGYTSDTTRFHAYKVVIVPSGFFHEKIYYTDESIPKLPLLHMEGVPILFGKPEIERIGDTLVIHADLIASAYFLLSRYEEMMRRRVRDKHGRFPGRESLPYQAGFIHRPVVDEYGMLLRKWLKQSNIQLSDTPKTIRCIRLTHDVDEPFAYRSWRNLVRGIKEGKSIRYLLRTKYGKLENDPFYTFPWLLETDTSIREVLAEKCDICLFFKAGGNAPQDKPHYDLRSNDLRHLNRLLAIHNGKAGLHSSYEAGKNPSCIPTEKARLEKALGQEIVFNRHHFLASREPEDMAQLEGAGITDDFTMGYADVAGFRLGTARPVRWINAAQQTLSNLVLHPLTIMDVTLSETNYMGLSAVEAQNYCIKLIEEIKKTNGELTLLWHNTTVSAENKCYHKTLYKYLLESL